VATIRSPLPGRSRFATAIAFNAFGHPFLSLGASDMPMSETAVVTVIPNVKQFFQAVGAGCHDGLDLSGSRVRCVRSVGPGAEDDPVKINLHTSRDRSETYSYEIANDSFLTAAAAEHHSLQHHLLRVNARWATPQFPSRGAINVKGQEPIEVDRPLFGRKLTHPRGRFSCRPISSLLGSGFDDVQIEGVTLDISSTDTKYAGNARTDRAQQN